METTTQQCTTTGEKLLTELLDEKGVPYVYCYVKAGAKAGDGKDIRSIPKSWTNWDYKTCMKYNTTADRKCNAINVNLNRGGLVVVDIDGGNIEELTKKHGGENITKSIRRQMPHLWFDKTKCDPHTTKTKVNGSEVDILYQNVFERKDSVIKNCNGYLDEFEWEEVLGAKTQKPVNKKTSPHKPTQSSGSSIGIQLLDMINIKYWSNYGDWYRLLSAIKNEFDNYEELAIHYSNVPGFRTEDGLEEIVREKINSLDLKELTMGTIHYYARISSPKEYAALLIPKIENDDQGIAELFLNAFGENIVKDIHGNTYVYYHDEWQRQNKEQALLLKGLITSITLPIVERAIEVNKINIEQTDSVTEKKKMENYEKNMYATRMSLRSAKGTDAIFRKMSSIVAMNTSSKIIFDIGSDQLYNIHFKNGVYDLKKREFRDRTRSDYITTVLDYDYYDERDETKMEIVENIYKKLQTNDEDRLFMLEWLASHLDGNISREKFKMNIGPGSNGKTMEFSIHAKALSIYCKKLNNEVFNKDFTKQHKEYFDLSYKPIRLVYIEELDKSKRLNIDKMKDFITGKKLPLEIMYGTQMTIDIQATLNICSNHDPNAETDGGIVRRAILQRYRSTFEAGRVADDPVNRKFIKEEGVDEQFDEDAMKLAYFHVLLKYYNPQFKIPAAIQNEFRNTLDEYDIGRQVFDKYFIMDTVSASVHKDIVVQKFESENIKGWRKILTEMKRFGICYNKNKRGDNDGVRGAFMGIKLRNTDEEEEVEDI